MKLEVTPAESFKIDFSSRDDTVKKFAEQFVYNLIGEAVRQSSKTTWLIHCSENCHKLSSIQSKLEKEYLCWTPECDHLDESADNIDCSDYLDEERDTSKYVLSCNSLEVHKSDNLSDDGYTLPIDTIPASYNKNANGRFKHSKPQSNCNKCLKPKAIHALNLIKSTHQKTFSDFKLFLLNLYSSSDVSTRNLGSEHSAFTTYSRRSNLSYTMNCVSLDKNAIDCKQNNRECYGKALHFHKKDENLKILRIKNEKDLIKPLRKYNRIKRCNFSNIKHSLCSVFKLQKSESKGTECFAKSESLSNSFKDRCLPPLPCQTVYPSFSCEKGKGGLKDDVNAARTYHEKSLQKRCGQHLKQTKETEEVEHCIISEKKLVDFATNIEKVKDYGWYWGPMSSEAAEKLLLNEPDGSFIVRDSSDDRYIFSLTFKLNACIRHVRIEHGQGNFSFGSDTNFKSDTIVDFIENAIQHSRSGRYLFFIHRRPILGPMRVLLLYPVSRFKGHVPSLQHLCRFVILKTVRRDLIPTLPLPKSVLDYLSRKDYYTEQSF